MEKLLNDLLIPSKKIDAENELEKLISTSNGQEELKTLLKENCTLAYVYIKNITSIWLTTNQQSKVVSVVLPLQDTLYCCVAIANDVNFNILCSYLEFLSKKEFLNKNFAFLLIEQLSIHPLKDIKFRRCLKALRAIFKKYEVLSRSDDLYSEIIRTVTLFKGAIFNLLIAKLSNDPDIVIPSLDIFYSLVFQDIHPFFEENSEKFFNTFFILFHSEIYQSRLCDIFKIFILKYADCINIETLLEVLLNNTHSYEYNQYNLILLLIKRRQIHVLRKNLQQIIYVISVGAIMSKKEMTVLYEDPISYIRSVQVLKQDSFRSVIFDICTCMTLFLKDEFIIPFLKSLNLEKDPLKQERDIFLCMVMSKYTGNLNNTIYSLLNGNTSDNSPLVVTCLRYLLLIENYEILDLSSVLKHLNSSFTYYFCILFLTKYLKNGKDRFINQENKIYLSNPGVINVVENKLENLDEEFSCEFLLQLYYVYKIPYFCTKNYLIFLIEKLEKNMLNVGSYTAYFNLFDLIGLFLIRGIFFYDEIQLFCQKILSKEVTELYSMTFCLLSILIRRSKKKLTYLVDLVCQKQLWLSKELIFSLSVLCVALYDDKMIDKNFIESLVKFLLETNSLYSAFFILYRTQIPNCLEWCDLARADIEYKTVLAYKIYKKNIITKNTFISILHEFVSQINNRPVDQHICGIVRNVLKDVVDIY
ncbi:hypothetical protein CWI39_2212p0010, partial [Hamiltosporidium magnivora]